MKTILPAVRFHREANGDVRWGTTWRQMPVVRIGDHFVPCLGEVPATRSLIRSSEGYRRTRGARDGLVDTAQSLLAIVTELESIDRVDQLFRATNAYRIRLLDARCVVDINMMPRLYFTILGRNYEKLAVQGPVNGYSLPEEAVADLRRAAIAIIAWDLQGRPVIFE